MKEQTPPVSASGAKRRSTRIVHTVPLLVTSADTRTTALVEETATVSINCHGCRYLSRQRLKADASVMLQIAANHENAQFASPRYAARVAWARKSRRLGGMYQVGVEFEVPLNIWDADEIPDDWATYSPAIREEPDVFLAEVDRILNSAATSTYYQLLGTESCTPQPEVKRHFYQLARRFHPDHHMDHPELTPKLLELMDALTTAYKTLSDDGAKKKYDSLLARRSEGDSSDSKLLAQEYVEKARECMTEKNYAGGILWLHRAIENEPRSSAYRTLLGRCLSAIPEYRREAVEQFEMAIDLDTRNLSAYLCYGELLEVMKLPGRARAQYLRVLELDMSHREARERLNHLEATGPRSISRFSLLERLTGRRMK